MLVMLKAMHESGVDYVLVGGVAMNLHGFARVTEDVDLFVRTSEANIALVREALRRVWDDPAIEEISLEDLAGDYPVVRYGPPDEDFIIDLMSRLGEAVSFDDLEAVEIVADGVPIKIATPTTLYKMKRDTVRPIDRQDAAALKQAFGIQE